jgi:hypothetical protein
MRKKITCHLSVQIRIVTGPLPFLIAPQQTMGRKAAGLCDPGKMGKRMRMFFTVHTIEIKTETMLLDETDGSAKTAMMDVWTARGYHFIPPDASNLFKTKLNPSV